MSFTVIIPSKNRLDLLQQCIASLRKHTTGGTIVVVDTGSGPDWKWAMGQGCQTIHMPDATYAQANNEAVRRYPNTNLILLNNDCFLLAPVKVQSTGIAGARLLYPDGLVQHAGIGFNSDGGGWNLWRLAPAEHPEVIKARHVPAVTFAYAVIPLHVWQEVGGMDEDYTNAYEDVDFCLRARELGIPIRYDPDCVAMHLEGQTEGRNAHLQESWQHFSEKWISTGRVYYALGSWPFNMRG